MLVTSNMAPAHPPLIEVVLVYPAFVGHRGKFPDARPSTPPPDHLGLKSALSGLILSLKAFHVALPTLNFALKN